MSLREYHRKRQFAVPGHAKGGLDTDGRPFVVDYAGREEIVPGNQRGTGKDWVKTECTARRS